MGYAAFIYLQNNFKKTTKDIYTTREMAANYEVYIVTWKEQSSLKREEGERLLNTARCAVAK